MTRGEWQHFKAAFYRGELDKYDVMEKLIDVFWETQDLKGTIYALEEMLDGRG